MGVGAAAFLLLPLLISGYLFNLIFYPFRYFASRAEGQKLFFMAAGSGFFLGAAVFLFAPIARHLFGATIDPVHQFITAAVPVPHASKMLSTFGLAVVLGLLCNGLAWIRYKNRQKRTAKCVYDSLTRRFGNPLDQLFWQAAESQKLVVITLKSRKVYCGRIMEVPGNLDTDGSFIEMLPSFSGYRDKETLSFGSKKTEYPVITLWEVKQYIYSLEKKLGIIDEHMRVFRGERAHEFLIGRRRKVERELEIALTELEGVKEPPNFDPKDWVKVFPVAEIESASFYDMAAYEVWFKREGEGVRENGTAPVASSNE